MNATLVQKDSGLATANPAFVLSRNCYIKNAVLSEEDSILPLPGRLEASGAKSVWGEVSQESLKNRMDEELIHESMELEKKTTTKVLVLLVH